MTAKQGVNKDGVNTGVNKDGVNTGVNSKKTTDDPDKSRDTRAPFTFETGMGNYWRQK